MRLRGQRADLRPQTSDLSHEAAPGKVVRGAEEELCHRGHGIRRKSKSPPCRKERDKGGATAPSSDEINI